MAADWDLPTTSSLYTVVLSQIDAKARAAAKMDFTGDSNLPTGAIRYNSLTSALERWSGAAWVEVVPLPTNHIGGLITGNDAGDTDHDIEISPGACRDVDDSDNMRLAAALTKQIDAVWALGDDAGGLDEGSVVTNQLYLLWLIKRSDTGVVDAIFSILGLLEKKTTISADTTDDSYNDSANGLGIFKVGQKVWVEGFANGANNGEKTVVTSAAGKITVSENLVTEAAGPTVTITALVGSPKMPSNYDRRRLIAAVHTDGSANIYAYTQSGDEFIYLGTPAGMVDSSITSLTWETTALPVPPNATAQLHASLANPTTTGLSGYFNLRTKGANLAVSTDVAWGSVQTGTTFDRIAGIGRVLVTQLRQIEYAAVEADGSAQLWIATRGFTFHMRREP